MVIGTAPERPPVFALRFLDGKVVDACMPDPHHTVTIELPVLVSIRSIPVSRVVMPLVCKTDGNAIVIKCPQLLNEPIVQFLGPLASKKSNNLRSSVNKLGSISPSRVDCVGERYFLGITGIPTVFSQANLLNRGIAREWWHRWASRHGFSFYAAFC